MISFGTRRFALPSAKQATELGGMAAVLGVYAWLALRFWWVTDDAYISFRYARNWVDGFGLRYNPGEDPPVEGYSDFLWVAAAAAQLRAGLDPVRWMPVLSLVCGAVLLVRFHVVATRRFGVSPLVSVLCSLALALSPPMALWATSGLETMPFALLVFLAFEGLVLADGPWLGGALAGLGVCLVRTEGVAWLLVIATLGVLAGNPSGVLRSIAAIVPCYGAYFGWRWGYYQSLFANTVYVKIGFGWYAIVRGLEYLASTSLALLAPVAFYAGLPAALRGDARARAVAAMAVAFPAYAVVVGGDYLPMGRLLLPGLPFAALLLAMSGERLRRSRPSGAVAWLATVAFLGVLPAFGVSYAPQSVFEALRFRGNTKVLRTELEEWRFIKAQTASWITLGRLMRQATHPGESWVTGGIGAVGYYSDLFIYDLGGLVNREVARRPFEDREARDKSPGHEKTVTNDFFFDLRPTYLKAELVQGDDLARRVPEEIRGWNLSARVQTRYVPDFGPVSRVRGTPSLVVFARRVKPREDAHELWETLDERAAVLGR